MTEIYAFVPDEDFQAGRATEDESIITDDNVFRDQFHYVNDAPGADVIVAGDGTVFDNPAHYHPESDNTRRFPRVPRIGKTQCMSYIIPAGVSTQILGLDYNRAQFTVWTPATNTAPVGVSTSANLGGVQFAAGMIPFTFHGYGQFWGSVAAGAGAQTLYVVAEIYYQDYDPNLKR